MPQETSAQALTATAPAVASLLANNEELNKRIEADWLGSASCDAYYGGEGSYISEGTSRFFAEMIGPAQKWLDTHFWAGVRASADEAEWTFDNKTWETYVEVFEAHISIIEDDDLRTAHSRLIGAHQRYLRRKAIAEMSEEERKERAVLAELGLELPIGSRFETWLGEACEEEGHECEGYSPSSDVESPYEWCPGCMLWDEVMHEFNIEKRKMFPSPPPSPRPVFDMVAWRAQEKAKYVDWLAEQPQYIKDIIAKGDMEARYLVKDLYHKDAIDWCYMLDDLEPDWEAKSRAAGDERMREQQEAQRHAAATAPAPAPAPTTYKPRSNGFQRVQERHPVRNTGGWQPAGRTSNSSNNSNSRPAIPDKVAAPEGVRAVACNKMPAWETPPAHWPENVRCAGGEPYMHSAQYRKWLKVSFAEAGITAPEPEEEEAPSSEEEFDISLFAKKRK